MILVYFRGRGEWFRRDNKKLAVVRTTTKPYRDPACLRQLDDYGLGYEEWLNGAEDSDENFSEWVNQHEEYEELKRNPPDKSDFEPYRYHWELGGTFSRDNNVQGDIYDTNNLCCWGADYIDCKYIEGVFKLNEEDEKHFRLTNKVPEKDWSEFRKAIKTLLPCEHSDSAFAQFVRAGKLNIDDKENLYFELQKKRVIKNSDGESVTIYPEDGEENIIDFVSADEINLCAPNSGFSSLLNEPGNKDDWFYVINHMVNEFHNEYGCIPNGTQAWNRLFSNPPIGYAIERDLDNNRLIIIGIPRKLDRDNFTERWAKYTKK